MHKRERLLDFSQENESCDDDDNQFEPFSWIVLPTSYLFSHVKRLKGVACVARLGDILDFGQLFKAFGNN